MIKSMGEVPAIDEAFYYSFCGGGKKSQKNQNATMSLASPGARQKFLESIS